MPTYRNDTRKYITHQDMGYMRWRPGESKALMFHVPYEKLGLTLADENPKVPHTIYMDGTIFLDPGDSFRLDMVYSPVFELSCYIIPPAAVDDQSQIPTGVTVEFGDSGDTGVITIVDSRFSKLTYSHVPYVTFMNPSATLQVMIRYVQEAVAIGPTWQKGGN